MSNELFSKKERFVALHYRDFRLLWIGQFISVTGSQMQIVALNWHIYLLTGSPIALGMIGLMRFIPIVFFSLIGGSVTDAYNRKKLQMLTQTILALLAGVLAVVTISGHITPQIIYSITVLSAITLSFDMPARQAMIPSLIPKEYLTNAVSLNATMFQVATIVGPSMAGLLIARFSVGSIYAYNAFSFIAVLLALCMMKTNGSIAGKSTPVSFQGIKEGLLFVKSQTIIWSTMLLDFFSTLFASASALLPIFAKDILAVGPEGLGILYAAPAVGACLAGITVSHMGRIKHQGKVLLTAVTIYGLATILFGLSKVFWLSFLALFLSGVGDSISTIIRNTVRQLITPDHLRGRMVAINMIFFMGGPQLGEFEAGILASAIGGPLSVIVGGIGTLITVGLVAWRVPKLREFHTDKHL